MRDTQSVVHACDDEHRATVPGGAPRSSCPAGAIEPQSTIYPFTWYIYKYDKRTCSISDFLDTVRRVLFTTGVVAAVGPWPRTILS